MLLGMNLVEYFHLKIFVLALYKNRCACNPKGAGRFFQRNTSVGNSIIRMFDIYIWDPMNEL